MKRHIGDRSRTLVAVVRTGCCLAVLGCGSANPTIPVSGVVQLDGAPLEGGKVLFSSLDGRKPAAGQIQSDGGFVLTTAKPGDGAAPGRYRLAVVSNSIANGNNTRVNCIPPKSFQIAVQPDQTNDFVINISESAGWELVPDD